MGRRSFKGLVVAAVVALVALGTQVPGAAQIHVGTPTNNFDVVVGGSPTPQATGSCMTQPRGVSSDGTNITFVVVGSAQSEATVDDGVPVFTEVRCIIYQDLDRDGKWNDKGGCFMRSFASASVCRNLALRVRLAPIKTCVLAKAGYFFTTSPTFKGELCPKKTE